MSISPTLCNYIKCKTNTCVPDLCKTIGVSTNFAENLACEGNKNTSVTLNQLYSGLYIAGEQLPLLTQGIPQMIEHKARSWIFSSIILQSLPFIIMMIILFIILIAHKTVSAAVGIILIILAIILPIISFIIFGEITLNTANDIFKNVKQITQQNFDTYKAQIGCDISHAIVCPDAIKCT